MSCKRSRSRHPRRTFVHGVWCASAQAIIGCAADSRLLSFATNKTMTSVHSMLTFSTMKRMVHVERRARSHPMSTASVSCVCVCGPNLSPSSFTINWNLVGWHIVTKFCNSCILRTIACCSNDDLWFARMRCHANSTSSPSSAPAISSPTPSARIESVRKSILQCAQTVRTYTRLSLVLTTHYSRSETLSTYYKMHDHNAWLLHDTRIH